MMILSGFGEQTVQTPNFLIIALSTFAIAVGKRKNKTKQTWLLWGNSYYSNYLLEIQMLLS
jgi:hypothetical protein